MPILIHIKKPNMTLLVEGEIKDGEDAVKEYDEMFGGCLMVKGSNGKNIVVPIREDSNIAFMQEVTREEVEEQRKRAEEAKKGSMIDVPSGSIGRQGGGGMRLGSCRDRRNH